MSYNARNLREENGPIQSTGDGYWMMAKPLPAPLWWRVREAWLVIKGEAEVIVWPKQS